jgi:polyisoprenoid-binding protein YceI
MKGFILTAAAVLALAAAPGMAASAAYQIDKNHSEASFKVRHLTGNVRGRFNDFAGSVTGDPAKPEGGSVEFTIKSASIDTGVPDRDNHLKSADFFDATKYPDITFKSSKITAKGNNQFDVAGTLTMRGVAKEVVLPVTLLGTGKDPRGNDIASFELETKLNRKDYGISWNRALDAGGVILGDEVTIEINLETNAKNAPAAAK